MGMKFDQKTEKEVNFVARLLGLGRTKTVRQLVREALAARKAKIILGRKK